MDLAPLFRRARAALADADGLLIGAGAGMGVDSGLPDFRGEHGFWRAYPLYAKMKLDFISMANPRWFERDPGFAWGFYGHRLNLYRTTVPHAGFATLLRWAQRLPHGAFVFTSNVDGQFQRAGFAADRVHEVHGSIHHVQCVRGCGVGILPADEVQVHVDLETMRAQDPLPACPGCGGLLRPNILMFGDGGWDDRRSSEQEERLAQWLSRPRRLLIVECGAGTAIPSVRHFCEHAAALTGGTHVRINPREDHFDPGRRVPAERQIGLPLGAKDGIQGMDEAVAA